MAAKTYRQEIKQLLSPAQTVLLEQRIRAILPPDIHNKDNNSYLIRSIYFDTITDRAYEEKESGIYNREKIRIRFYDYQDNLIKLERKEKKGNLINKESLTISKETAEAMISGDYNCLPAYKHPLTDRIYSMGCSEGLRPTVVVDYVRSAYVYPVGNVRITFDKALQAGRPDISIWKPGGVFDVLSGTTILEIKFDQYLPEHIRLLLCSVPGEKIALSKYVLSRQNLLWKQGNYLGGRK